MLALNIANNIVKLTYDTSFSHSYRASWYYEIFLFTNWSTSEFS